MSMPNELIFVRHGQSEANIIQKADKDGIRHEKEQHINDRPDWKQRLSQLGIEQAKMAKEWIDQNLGGVATFDFRYFSPFLRTRETAAYIGGKDCGDWTIEDRVVERSWGVYGSLPKDERESLFALTAKAYSQSPWYIKLDGGESRYEVSDRFRDFQATLHREASGKKVIVVTHGDLIGIARYNIERMLPEHFEEMEDDDSQTIKNCTIVHYSRVNPTNKDDVRDRLTWRRMIHPTMVDQSPFGGQWVELPSRPRYTGAELLAQAELAPRLIED
jgi:broad specificity phosphatase PhoE